MHHVRPALLTSSEQVPPRPCVLLLSVLSCHGADATSARRGESQPVRVEIAALGVPFPDALHREGETVPRGRSVAQWSTEDERA